MKQTAIEWLVDQMFKQGYFDGNKPLTFTNLDHLQQEAKEMEKQQMCEFAEYVATYPDKNRNVYAEMLHAKTKYDGADRTIDLLETFKK